MNKLLAGILLLSVTSVFAQTVPPAAPGAEVAKPAIAPPLSAGESDLLREENARLRLEVERLRSDSVNAPVIDRENQQLREKILTMESERGRLTHENQTLGSWRDGLKTGAGIFVIGLVIGLLLGRVRRRSGWSEV